MARIRSIKPELRRSLTVGEWPIEVRYAWVLLWGYLDDWGRGVDDIRLVRSDLFPLDPHYVTEKRLETWLTMMTAIPEHDPDEPPPLCRYTDPHGRRYMHAVKWFQHQRVGHPGPSKCPPCPEHEKPDRDS
jgi:hypothetical protein